MTMTQKIRTLRAGEIVQDGDHMNGTKVAKKRIGEIAPAMHTRFTRVRRPLPVGSSVRLATHGGKHHADELLAEHILRVLFNVTEIVHVTDDAVDLNSFDFVIDVGREYNPEEGKFDHHIGTPGVPFRPDNRPCCYATGGLVWDYYGEDYIRRVIDQSARWASIVADLDEEELTLTIYQIKMQMDREIVCPIDRWDGGSCKHHPSVLPLQTLIPFIPQPMAVECLGEMFISRVKTLLVFHLGAYEIMEGIQTGTGSKVYMFGDRCAVVGKLRVESVAARHFLTMFEENLELLAVVSPISRRNQWVALFEDAVSHEVAEASGLSYMGDHRMFFADSPEILLDFIKQIAGFTEEPIPEEDTEQA
jgi:hypothetical protein